MEYIHHGHHKRLTSFFFKVVGLFPKRFVLHLFNLSNGYRGNIGFGIRYICLKRLAASCGENVALFPHVTMKHVDRMHIGNNVSIHTTCYLDALGGIIIGNNTSIAHASSIISFDHTYLDRSLPIKYCPVETAPVIIREDVWIGCGCRILKGITIGSRCVVAAGSVVTKNVPSYSLVAGVPAKIIKQI